MSDWKKTIYEKIESPGKSEITSEIIEKKIESIKDKENQIWRILYSLKEGEETDKYGEVWEWTSQIDELFRQKFRWIKNIDELKIKIESESKILWFLEELITQTDILLKQSIEKLYSQDDLEQVKKVADKQEVTIHDLSKLKLNPVFQFADDLKDNTEVITYYKIIIENALKSNPYNINYLERQIQIVYKLDSKTIDNLYKEQNERIFGEKTWYKIINEIAKSKNLNDNKEVFLVLHALNESQINEQDIKNAFVWNKINMKEVEKIIYSISNIYYRYNFVDFIENLGKENIEYLENRNNEIIEKDTKKNWKDSIFNKISPITKKLIEENKNELCSYDFDSTETQFNITTVLDWIIKWKINKDNIKNELDWLIYKHDENDNSWYQELSEFLSIFSENKQINDLLWSYNKILDNKNDYNEIRKHKEDVIHKFFPEIKNPEELDKKSNEFINLLEGNLETKDWVIYIKNLSSFKKELNKFFWENNPEWEKIENWNPLDLLKLISDVYKERSEKKAETIWEFFETEKYSKLNKKDKEELNKIINDSNIWDAEKIKILKQKWLIKDWKNIWDTELKWIIEYLQISEKTSAIDDTLNDDQLSKTFSEYWTWKIDEKTYKEKTQERAEEKRKEELLSNWIQTNKYDINKAKLNEIIALPDGNKIQKIDKNSCKILFDWNQEVICNNKDVKNILSVWNYFKNFWLWFLITDFAEDKQNLKWDIMRKIASKDTNTDYNLKNWLSEKEQKMILSTFKKILFDWSWKEDLWDLTKFFKWKTEAEINQKMQEKWFIKSWIINAENKTNLVTAIN